MLPHEKKTNTDKEQIMRRKIMNKAFDLMAKKGIDQVSMREIAAAVRVTKPVLYYYFKDKEDLCKSIIGSNMVAFHDNLIAQADKGLSLKEICERSFEMHLEYFKDNPKNLAFIIHVMSYSAKGGKRGGESFIEVKHERKKMMDKMFKSFEDKGEIPKNSCADMVHIFSAGLMHFMINTATGFHFDFDKGLPQRYTEIMFLGIKEFYKEKKKK